MTRWRGLFRSIAVPTLVFICPLVALTSSMSWVLFLTWPEIAKELSVRFLLLLMMEAAGVAVLCVALMLLSSLRVPSRRMHQLCGGILTIGILDVSLILATHPMKKVIFGIGATPGYIKLLALAVEAILIIQIGWQPIFELLDRLNRKLEPLLLLSPLLIVAPLLSGISLRPYDPMPVDPPPDVTIQDTRPSIVLITMDAFAAQDASLYGYPLPTTPNLDRLSHRSYNFTRFSSTCSFTTTAVCSLLTGMYPFSHRVFQLGGHLPARLADKNLPSVLKQHGFTTAAIVTNPYAHPLHLRIGNAFTYLPEPPMSPWFRPAISLLQLRRSMLFGNVFLDEKFPYVLLDIFGGMIPGFNLRPVVNERAVFDSAQEFIENSPTPFFLWVHVFPPHFPYIVRPPFLGRFLESSEFTTQSGFQASPATGLYSPSQQTTVDELRLRYDEYVSEVDAALGEFLNWLSHSPHGSNIVLVVTADHGESFHHYFTHASPDLHYPELHIPLLISLPGQTVGETDSRDADLTDLAPTILQLVGIEIPDWMEGQSLIGSKAPVGESSFAAALSYSSVFTRLPSTGAVAATHGDYKYVWYFPSHHGTLFDIDRDPEETEDLAAKRPALAAQMRATIQHQFGKYLE